MENRYSVYKHTNKFNNKSYIGMTSQVPRHRWGINGVNYKECSRFWNAIQEYGWDNFSHDILYSDLSKEEACEMEKKLIAEYNTQDVEFGYNIEEGGAFPRMAEETKKKIAIALVGNKNGLGKVCSPEKKEKIRLSNLGKIVSEETRRKQSLAKKGKHHAPPSMETKKKISDSHKKKAIICVETNIVYPSIQGCSKTTGISATAICAVCRGRMKAIHGFHFRYVDSNNA